jgi:ribosomal protein S12 methylthiotransferase accessory factor
MSIEIDIDFPGGKRVDAHFKGFSVATDQCVADGGQAQAPEPFDLFFVSIATCAGIYALEFCNSRQIATDGLKVRLETHRDPETKLYSPIKLMIAVPRAFPPKYHKALVRSVNMCTVKKHIEKPIVFETCIEGDSPP